MLNKVPYVVKEVLYKEKPHHVLLICNAICIQNKLYHEGMPGSHL